MQERRNAIGADGALKSGTQLRRRYTIIGAIGADAYETVYEAKDEKLDRRVAVREYFPRTLGRRAEGSDAVSPISRGCGALFFLGSEAYLSQYRALCGAVGSPNVLSVFDAFFENGTVYAVTELLEGVTLEGYLALIKGALPASECAAIAAAMGDALLVVRSSNTTHSDLDAKSIFLCADGAMKLTYFGAARAVLRAHRALEDDAAEERKDICALGRTLYQAATGRMLEKDETPSADTALPPSLNELLLRMQTLEGASGRMSVFDLRYAASSLDIAPSCPAVSQERLAEQAAQKKPRAGTLAVRTEEAARRQTNRTHDLLIRRRIVLLYAGVLVVVVLLAVILRAILY